MKNILFFLFFALAFFSCSSKDKNSLQEYHDQIPLPPNPPTDNEVGGSSYNMGIPFRTMPKEHVRFYDQTNGKIVVKMYLNSPKNVYFVFSNLKDQEPNRDDNAGNKRVSGPIYINKINVKSTFISSPFTNSIVEFDDNELNFKEKKSVMTSRVVGDKIFVNRDGKNYEFSLLAETPRIETNFGIRCLKIYYSPYALSKKNLETYKSEFANLANIFLKPGFSNDIFDKMTDVFGTDQSSSNILYKLNLMTRDEIRVFFYDIDDDYAPGNIGVNRHYLSSYTAGYFSPSFTFQSTNDSSRNVPSFFIDLPLFDLDYESSLMTLLHEFQHMIQFGERPGLVYSGGKTAGISEWLNEGFSMAAIDIFSQSLNYDNSSIKFNFKKNPNYQYRPWVNDVESYNSVFFYFAYLLRNFGGTKLINAINIDSGYDLSDSSSNFENKLAQSLRKLKFYYEDYNSTLRKFGASIILSDNNYGISTLGYNESHSEICGETYSLSGLSVINGLTMQSEADLAAGIQSFSNAFYRLGGLNAGEQTIEVTVPNGVYLTVVLKDI